MDEMSLVTIHPKRIRWMKNPWDVVSGFKHDNRLKCHRGIVSQWTFQVGLNVTVDKTWVDVTSRHPSLRVQYSEESVTCPAHVFLGPAVVFIISGPIRTAGVLF